MPDAPHVTDTTAALMRALWDALHTPEWISAVADPARRTEILTIAVCEALRPFGRVALPSPEQVIETFERHERNERIQAEFREGATLKQLARKYRRTPRQIRRIVTGHA